MSPASIDHTGMGAIPYDGGVTFRVWTKFAAAVSVAGDFNGWVAGATPLARDGGSDYWSVDVPGAMVGQGYKFCITTAGAGNVLWRMDPYASSIQRASDGTINSLVASKDMPYEGQGYATPRWNEAVIYELHIPSFTTQADGSAGTFATALPRLSDLADLGINAIEIMPLGQFTGVSDTGYNPGYIFAVEDTFGGPDGFRDFVNKAHACGIAVILDVVYNHIDGLDMWQFDGWANFGTVCPFDPPNTTDGGIYFFEDGRAHTPYGHARFDLGRPEVCQYLFDNAMRWLKDRFVDGLRFDSTTSIRAVAVMDPYWHIAEVVPEGQDLLRRINGEIRASQPWKLTIAEDLQGWSEITAPLEDPAGFGFGAQWNDGFCWQVRTAAVAASDAGRNLPGLANSIASLNGESFRSVIYSENHDKDDPAQGGSGRLPEIIGNGQADSWFAKKQSTLAAAVVLTSPGIPMLFQGQEFLEYRPFPTYGSNPQPIDWGRKTQFAGIWTLYRDLIRLRRDWYNNTRGLRGTNVHVLPVYDNMLVYHRWDQGGAGDDVVVVCNFANQRYQNYAIGLPRPGIWRVRLNSDAGVYDGFFEGWNSFDITADGPPLNDMPCSGSLSIGAYTCVVLSQD
jgi:1,4-alpha-glucan branching enzyme